VEFLRVNVAVLLVTDAHTTADEATVKLIIDRLTSAGHHIAECEVLQDRQQLVRAQYLKWIADPQVDVVITIAGIDTSSAQPALEPSITRSIEGFAELVRMISYEEIGTGAMLVDVAAAQCGSTFVFVLPASMGAVRSALDKLLLPQLDSRTKPRNLVMRMPRLKSAGSSPPSNVAITVVANDAVPVSISSEKTALGVTPAAGPRAPRAPTPPPPPPRARGLTPPVPVKVIVPARMREPQEVVELTKPKAPAESQAAANLKELWKEPTAEGKPLSPTAFTKPATPAAGVKPIASITKPATPIAGVRTIAGVEAPAALPPSTEPAAVATKQLPTVADAAKPATPNTTKQLPTVAESKPADAARTAATLDAMTKPKAAPTSELDDAWTKPIAAPEPVKATDETPAAAARTAETAQLAKIELVKQPAPAGLRDIVETTRAPRAVDPAEEAPASLQRRNVVPPIAPEPATASAVEPVAATAPPKRLSTEDAVVLEDGVAELIAEPPKPPPLPPRKKVPTGSVDDIPTFLPPRIAEPPARRRGAATCR
jgi:molybdenum cofactor biosynthesis protein B